MSHCLIAAPDAQAIADALAAQGFPHLADVRLASCAKTIADNVEQARVILAKPALIAPHLEQATSLRWLQSTYAGVEPLVAPGLRRDYVLTGVKGIFGPLMREYVFGKLLELQRHFADYHVQQAKQLWQPKPYRSLVGQTLALVGVGSIGGDIAQTAQHFGMRVIGVNRSGRSVAGLDACYRLDHVLDASGETNLLQEVDAVVLALPSTPALTRRIGEAFFNGLKPGAILINVGRGSCIDESALMVALGSGQLSAAVLDVFEQEPLPAEHPFWCTPNLQVTPHISAVTFASDIARLFADNYARYLADEPLLHRIDFERGY